MFEDLITKANGNGHLLDLIMMIYMYGGKELLQKVQVKSELSLKQIEEINLHDTVD